VRTESIADRKLFVSTNEKGTTPIGRFGTFGGVFTPCVLTILGVIMFLRYGYVVGQAGVIGALIILLVSKVITGLTGLSLSAIATNTEVKGGGAYFLISRSLGVEFGGAIGLVFFLAQAISVSLYVLGFSEAFCGAMPGFSPESQVLVATITNIVVFGCVFVGAGWTIKLQYFILAVLMMSLVSFGMGAIPSFDPELLQTNLKSNYTGNENLFTMFALFFPAVTGIMAGVNMSGDLKDPAKSIPGGTLWSILVTAIIYAGMAVLLAGAATQSELTATGDVLVVGKLSKWPVWITAGVFAATLSSALGSMMGAPRILQAFAKDSVFKWLNPFAAGSGAAQEPRRAIIVTFIISQVCIVLADLNTIAPLITMFFMVTYGLLNLATFYESITQNPSYRPRFRWSHWSTSLLGAIGCFLVMFLIDWRWALVAIAAITALHAYIRSAKIQASWGDMQSGLTFQRTRSNLLKLEDQLYHPKNWRPNVLALSGAGFNRLRLSVYGFWFTSGRGILMIGQVIQGEVKEQLERHNNQERMLHEYIREQSLQAFPAVVVAPTVSTGIESLVMCVGLGELRPNTILLGWPREAERVENFGGMLRTIEFMERSILISRFSDPPKEGDDSWATPEGTIDVWWRGKQNGELMLLLAHLLTQNDGWRGREIRLLRVIENPAGREEVEQHLNTLADRARIKTTCDVVVFEDFRGAIQSTSKDAAVVFMGFQPPDEGFDGDFYERIEGLCGDLKRVMFVNSNGNMSLES
jgi:amino acid transporter